MIVFHICQCRIIVIEMSDDVVSYIHSAIISIISCMYIIPQKSENPPHGISDADIPGLSDMKWFIGISIHIFDQDFVLGVTSDEFRVTSKIEKIINEVGGVYVGVDVSTDCRKRRKMRKRRR